LKQARHLSKTTSDRVHVWHGPQFRRGGSGPETAQGAAVADTVSDTLKPTISPALTRTLSPTMSQRTTGTMFRTVSRTMRDRTPQVVLYSVRDRVCCTFDDAPADTIQYTVYDTLGGTLRLTMRVTLRGPIATSVRGSRLRFPGACCQFAVGRLHVSSLRYSFRRGQGEQYESASSAWSVVGFVFICVHPRFHVRLRSLLPI